jgi:hypothetical protein
MNRVIHFFIATMLITGFAFSQTIRKLDIPAGATDLADPPYKRYQYLKPEGIDVQKSEVDLSFHGKVTSEVIELDYFDFDPSDYGLVVGSS